MKGDIRVYEVVLLLREALPHVTHLPALKGRMKNIIDRFDNNLKKTEGMEP